MGGIRTHDLRFDVAPPAPYAARFLSSFRDGMMIALSSSEKKIRKRNKDDEDDGHERWWYRHLHKDKGGSED
jgi:chloramphenicol 3-O-phosphotransferase